VCNPEAIKNDPIVRESGFGKYDASLFGLRTNGTGFQVVGYLQSYKYLSLVGRAFTFEKHIKDKAIRYLRALSTRNTVGFHVRRGDKMSETDTHIMVPDNFYARVVSFFQERFGDDFIILVVSDDQTWCKSFPALQHPKVVTSTDEFASPIEALALLAQCTHHVITIGTFGWWGAWLGTRRDTITLYHHEFNMEHESRKTSVIVDEYYPPSWIQVVQ
jgi:galactoside 2-L-fucosyltransferase 1/2